METNSLKHILEHPNENGIVIFVLGVLFVLSIYHFLLYFQHKEKSYLYYSLYTFLIFFGHLNEVTSGFIPILTKPFSGVLNYLDMPLMWLYNTVYFIFGFTFLNLKKYSKIWYSIIIKTMSVLIIIIVTVTLVGSFIDRGIILLSTVESFIVFFFFVFGMACYYPLLKYKMPLKYYIIFGSFILYLSSLLAYYLPKFHIISLDNNSSYSIFYFGVIIENVIFSLGLGHKQKMILQEKNESQKDLILQLQENEQLRYKIHKQLEEDLVSFSEQAEKDKYEKLKAEYDRELVELKISSLRSQMNPHFIFNSLNAIKLYIIDNDKENAVYYLNKFSKLIRKILAVTREKEITLAEEIETIKLYLDIENIRFQNEIKTSFTIDKNLSLDTIKIPSLILQPFIENSIWHGLSSKKGVKNISLTFKKEKKYHFKICIEDNGIGREKSAKIKQKKIHKKESIGIQLTEVRLSNFTKEYQHNYRLLFEDLYDKNNIASGTKVTLKIPLY